MKKCKCGHGIGKHEYTRDWGRGSGRCRDKKCSCTIFSGELERY